ncbi:hypothetical protein [Paenibacillus xylanivorans]|jgi:hypothetical protein|uniref:Group-specific protein n=1 Tax=Paenibacillus xylanivorans TaxID=1705561 RepID=A0A0N0UHZ6_9BACL|nr:hypothetical protein [Paenibacillus xylanivorans]KOY16557.1 hypothetical protein AMS66_11965 [Paenibacillus xylanivorans]
MENVSTEVKMESFQAFQSTIRKSENALANMSQKGSNTTLLDKRLNALYIGLAMLETAWNHKPGHYTEEDLTEARNVLAGLLPLLDNMYGKSKTGSPQKTLIERRIKAFELAVQAMDDVVKK